jgi:hypothetical protein
MILTVKTLKGGKFTVEVDPSNTVAEAKAVIVSLFIYLSSAAATSIGAVTVTTTTAAVEGGAAGGYYYLLSGICVY